MEFIFELVFRILFSYPGAFLRWMFLGFRGSFKKVDTPDDVELNTFFGIVFAVLIFLAFQFIS